MHGLVERYMGKTDHSVPSSREPKDGLSSLTLHSHAPQSRLLTLPTFQMATPSISEVCRPTCDELGKEVVAYLHYLPNYGIIYPY